jgi:hypothetical protein
MLSVAQVFLNYSNHSLLIQQKNTDEEKKERNAAGENEEYMENLDNYFFWENYVRLISFNVNYLKYIIKIQELIKTN